MSLIKEWTWDEYGSASEGPTLYTDKVVRWSVDWSDRSGGFGREWSIDEFISSGNTGGIPASVWNELNRELANLEEKET